MKTLRHALVFISALLGTSLLHAAPGDLDLGFGGGTGKVTTAIGASDDAGYSVIPAGGWQAGGGGVVAATAAIADVALVRYNADGLLGYRL
jgi:hypothetical protein